MSNTSTLSMIPTRLVVSAFAIRSARLWAVTRLALSAVFLLAGDNPLRLSMLTVVGIIALTTALGVIEIRRNREQAFLGNLAVSPALISAILWVPALLGEITIAIVGLLIS